MGEFHRAEEKPDAREYPSHRPAFDTLNALPTSAILALNRAVEARSLTDEAEHDVIEWMLWLPSDNVPRARAIYGAHLTGSEADRANVATYIGTVTHFDPQFGLVMADRLLSDPTSSVRSAARRGLDENLNLLSMSAYGERVWADEHPQVSAIDIAKLLYRALQVEVGTESPCDPSEPIPDIPLPAWAAGQTMPEQ